MQRLKDKYKGRKALIIIGGPSVLENKLDLSLMDKSKYAIFLEPKALTPRFVSFGIEPDYLMMFYPEKCKSNSFQNIIFLSFLADIDLSPLIREEFLNEYFYIKDNFDKYFELWKPGRGLHKKYRYKKDIYFKNSPFDLIHHYKNMGLITYIKAYQEHMPALELPNPIYQYDHLPVEKNFSLDEYFNPIEDNGGLKIRTYSFKDSAAIALFPILNYLGFNKVYFLGMDMSMLWSMEYSALYVFKSLKDFDIFFKKAMPAFNAQYKPNFWHKFMRPVSNIKALQQIVRYKKIEFVNIFEPFRFALPIKGIKNISWDSFLSS